MSLTLPASSTYASAVSGIGALSGMILASPQGGGGIQAQPVTFPNGSQSVPPQIFVFTYEAENTWTLESDITDHYVEDNTAIQDQIALRPEIVTTHGYVGELNDVIPAVLQPLATIASKLTPLTAYAPQLSVAALLALNEATQAYQVAQQAAAAASNVVSLLGGSSSLLSGFANQNKQQQAFTFFKSQWKIRALFTVTTPWGTFPNMAIKSVKGTQEPDTNTVSDFNVTFKQMRFAQTGIAGVTAGNLEKYQQGRAIAQYASPVNNGISGVTPAPGLFDPSSPGASLLT